MRRTVPDGKHGGFSLRLSSIITISVVRASLAYAPIRVRLSLYCICKFVLLHVDKSGALAVVPYLSTFPSPIVFVSMENIFYRDVKSRIATKEREREREKSTRDKDKLLAIDDRTSFDVLLLKLCGYQLYLFIFF